MYTYLEDTRYHRSTGLYVLTEALGAAMYEHDDLATYIKRSKDYERSRGKDEDVYSYRLDPLDMPDELLTKAANLSVVGRHPKLAKLLEAIRDFDTVPIPNFEAAYFMITRWLRKHVTTGWVYKIQEEDDAPALPQALTGIHLYVPDRKDRDDKPSISVKTVYSLFPQPKNRWGDSRDQRQSGGMTLHPADVSRKKVERIMLDYGLQLETPALRANYDAQHAHVDSELTGGLHKQYNGVIKGKKHKVLLMLADKDVARRREEYADSFFMWDAEHECWGSNVPLPVWPICKAFDLGRQEFISIHALNLTRYVYNPALANKLILPESHMDMLDVLTSETDVFLSDIIEGKSAGNIILCKGRPGLGKTLTAEIYSEIVGKPIYSVHSGALGTRASDVEKALETIFERVTDWDCILLLDEADVFVCERGNDLTQNAIVSVFLRTLEYFNGLMFMTTNRSDNIDDAIISRCAAIIEYTHPQRSDMLEVWKVMCSQQGVDIDDQLATDFADIFPSASPRDIKHLVRLALRVVAKDGGELDEAVLRRVAMFRAVEIAPVTERAHRKAVPNVRRRPRQLAAE